MLRMISLVAVLVCALSPFGFAAADQARPIRTAIDPASRRGKLLAATGLEMAPAKAVLAALNGPGVAVIDATPANLKALVAAQAKVKTFTDAGGWIMLWGATPDGLAEFNKLVGQNHLMRKFAVEEVDIPLIPDPMLDGVGRGDVFMETGQWSTSPPTQSPCAFRVGDAWSYVVDTGDIAPFCTLPEPDFWKKDDPQYDLPDWPRNMVNGLTYNWRFGFALAFEEGNDIPLKWPVKMPREESIVGFSITPWLAPSTISKVRLTFGDDGKPVDLDIKPAELRQTYTFPGRKTKSVHVEILDRVKGQKADVIGVLNFGIQVARSADYADRVQPLTNIGVLVRYPIGKGGILLNQLHVPEKEASPKNAAKKQRILKALLTNLAKQ
jgi:hypothetical protein